jgi:hypothetical protein
LKIHQRMSPEQGGGYVLYFQSLTGPQWMPAEWYLGPLKAATPVRIRLGAPSLSRGCDLRAAAHLKTV